MWANDKWRGQLFSSASHASEFLAQYARYFNAVEGNTTFYADPAADTVQRWLTQTPASFRFCLKIPKRISHQLAGPPRLQALTQWLEIIKPLQARLGLLHLQFAASQLDALLADLPAMLTLLHGVAGVAVEVRHPAFFQKGTTEQHLHQLLRQASAERVILDSRSLFALPPSTAALQEAWQKKPRLPVHVCALGNQPMFRFIGVADLAHNRPFYQPWLHKMAQWLSEGKTPYAFFHTEDNQSAPLLARQFAAELCELTGVGHPVLSPWPCELLPQQNQLF